MSDNYREFLKDYPVGVAQIHTIEPSGTLWIKVKTQERVNELNYDYYAFDPSDLIVIKE